MTAIIRDGKRFHCRSVLSLGMRLRHKQSGRIYRVDHLGSLMGTPPNERPIHPGPQIWLEPEENEPYYRLDDGVVSMDTTKFEDSKKVFTMFEHIT